MTSCFTSYNSWLIYYLQFYIFFTGRQAQVEDDVVRGRPDHSVFPSDDVIEWKLLQTSDDELFVGKLGQAPQQRTRLASQGAAGRGAQLTRQKPGNRLG